MPLFIMVLLVTASVPGFANQEDEDCTTEKPPTKFEVKQMIGEQTEDNWRSIQEQIRNAIR